MINAIIEFSAKNRFIVFIVVAAAVIAGWWSMRTVPLDALPDLSDTQVIVYSRWDRSPDIMEDQVTYPIVTAMLGAPKVKDVRGFSDFGYSYVYIIFEEGTDIYWARSRTLEYLSTVLQRLPQGVKTELGPDATGVGWVFEYALIDTTGKQSLADLRSYQDWYLRYYLKSVPGVAEVAPLGGFVRQYQVNVDPHKLQSFNIPISKVVEAVRSGNNDVGGRLVEFTGAEYMVRGRGYAQSTSDIGKIVLAKNAGGVPIQISDVGDVTLGPDIRRGVADWNGTGDTVAGIVIMRQGENALQVIERVKQKLHDIEGGLPAGVKVVTAYDRSELILRSIENLKHTLTEELIIVAIVILIFLWHVPSALVPIITIPVAVIISFIPMRQMGLTSNIMSLGGIAIAVGAMVDAAIVVVEQTHKKLEEWERNGPPGRLPPRGDRRRKTGGRSELLRASGHRRFVPSGVDSGSPGRPSVQAAGIYQKLLHDHCGGAGDYAGSRDPGAVHAHEEVCIPAAVAGAVHQCHPRGHNPFRGNSPDQQGAHQALRAGMRLGVAVEMVRHRRRRGSDCCDCPGLATAGFRIHAAAR